MRRLSSLTPPNPSCRSSSASPSFDGEADSPSFPRRILREFVPPWHKVIEYAIWWDWDIGHLYELEHAWSYIDADGRLVWAEASGHGDYSAMSLAGGSISCEGTHPVLYSQPGKHAFAPEPICLERVLHFVVKDAAREAGEGGVLVQDRYAHAIHLQEGDHVRVAAPGCASAPSCPPCTSPSASPSPPTCWCRGPC